MTWIGHLQRAGRSLLDLVYPPLCLGCDQPMPAVRPLCHRCLARLERAESEATWERVVQRAKAKVVLDEAFSGWRFDRGGALQRVQHAVKYENRPRYGVHMGRLLADALTDRPSAREALHRAELVAPVPLHRVRYLERGYNQSAMLGRGVSQALGLPYCDDAIEREHATRSQTDLSREERWENVRGAFAVSRAAPIAGRRVLLVDDLLTTGATAAAAATALHQADADAVVLVTLGLAHT